MNFIFAFASFSLVFAAVFGIPETCFSDYPKQYVAYKLLPGESIDLDGRLDEPAWTNVAPMGELDSLMGPASKSKPYLSTISRMRWDENCLYVGAYLEEPQAWVNHTEENTALYKDNDYEVFVDVGGSSFAYKEHEVNALNVRWNLLMVRPYLDGGPAVCVSSDPTLCSKAAPEQGIVEPWDIRNTWKTAVAVYGGKVNDPDHGTKAWSVEMCLPMKDMLKYTNANVPKAGDYWKINVMRVQWHVHKEVIGGKAIYVKDQGVPCGNWGWQPTGVENVHLPDRWGYVQFAQGEINKTSSVRDPYYIVRRTLRAIYESEKSYLGMYQRGYTDNVKELMISAFLDENFIQSCGVKDISISLNDDSTKFVATVTDVNGIKGSITQDRHTTLPNY